MKLGIAILNRIGFASNDEPDHFEERLKSIVAASASQARARYRNPQPSVFKTKPAHQAA